MAEGKGEVERMEEEGGKGKEGRTRMEHGERRWRMEEGEGKKMEEGRRERNKRTTEGGR